MSTLTPKELALLQSSFVDKKPDIPTPDFEVIPADVEPLVPVVVSPETPGPSSKKLDIDYDYARENLRKIIDTAKGSLEELAGLAKGYQAPRAYEVLAGFMRTIVESNRELIELTKATIETSNIAEKPSQQDKNTNTTNNIVFAGSTAELSELIKNMEKSS